MSRWRVSRLRPRRPRHATVVAYLALFAALGGSALALPGKNKVRSGDIKNTHVRAPEIQDGGVGPAELGAGSVGAGELQPNSVGTAEIGDGQVQAANLANNAVTDARIPTGAVTSADILDNVLLPEHFATSAVHAPDLTPLSLEADSGVNNMGGAVAGNGAYATSADTASCDPGQIAIGGAFSWGDQTNDLALAISEASFTTTPDGVATGFRAVGANDTATLKTFTVQVLCLTPTGP